MTQTVLVLGSTGRFGQATAAAFRAAGWQVREFRRDTDRLPEAAVGADVIVNGWNPAYPDWEAQLPGLIDQVIAAARECGATILQPANIYVYGEGSPEQLTPDTPRITFHARFADAQTGAAELAAIKARLADRYGIKDSTIQIETAAHCQDCGRDGAPFSWAERAQEAAAGQAEAAEPDLQTHHHAHGSSCGHDHDAHTHHHRSRGADETHVLRSAALLADKKA